MKEAREVNMIACLAYVSFFVLVGVPIWWKTTEVYRSPLPYSEISRLADLPVSYTIGVDVMSASPSASQLNVDVLVESLSSELNGRKESKLLAMQLWQRPAPVRAVYSVAKSPLGDVPAVNSLDDLRLFDATHCPNDTMVTVVLTSPGLFGEKQKAFVGASRCVYVPCDLAVDDVSQCRNDVDTVLHNYIVNEESMLESFLAARGQWDKRLSRLSKDKQISRGFPSGLDITFTLLNMQPEKTELNWDIEGAVNAYIDPFLAPIRAHSSVNVKSQMLFYGDMGVKPSCNGESESKTCYVKENELSQLVNSIEGKAGSLLADDSRTLHFVVLVPPRRYTPLLLERLKSDSNVSDTSASDLFSFVVSRWGSLLVVNPGYDLDSFQSISCSADDGSSCQSGAALNMKKVMSVFVFHLRKLLGVATASRKGDSTVEYLQTTTNIHTLELETWLRHRLLENVAGVSLTLQSLSTLVYQIRNMVIKDKVEKDVSFSVQLLRRALEQAKRPGSKQLLAAHGNSRQALIYAENAFFDSSLLGLLYFPEDQKFAIYVPLFIPVGFPMLCCLKPLYKYLVANLGQKKLAVIFSVIAAIFAVFIY